MKMSRRAVRMERRHKRKLRMPGFNIISLMDIFTILVFFLLVNSSDVEVLPSAKSIQLPESLAAEKPRETLVVMVTEREILLQGRRVTSIEQAMRGAETQIGSLDAALRDQAKRRLVKAVDRGPAGREITIMGDREIPFRLLKRVMLTCTKAGFGRISLSVVQKAT
jgi:biopolymer transport protein ExbD